MKNQTVIEVDLVIYKAIEGARLSFDETHNEILHRIIFKEIPTEPEKIERQKPNEGERVSGSYCFKFRDKRYGFGTQKAAYRNILILLQEEDKDFLDKLSEYQTSHGRRIISNDRKNLGTPVAQENAEILIEGYWYDTNLSLSQKKQRIETACNYANINYGIDLVLEF